MNDMKLSLLACLVPAGLLAVTTACGPSSSAVEKKSESTTQSSEGTVKETTQSTQVGTTLEATSVTKVDTPAGASSVKTETLVGTVTAYTPGKTLEVLTGEKKTHGFSLDDKNVVFSVDGTVAVGKHVTVVDETGTDKVRRVTVKISS
jgi:hypothetical protein